MKDMKKIIALFGFAALVLLSCQKEVNSIEEVSNASLHNYTVVINSATKTVFADGSDASHKDLNWADGDKIAVKFTDDSVVESTVSISGSTASVTVPVPDGEDIADAWFPSNNKVKPTDILQYQSSNSIDIPLGMSSIAGNVITFVDIVDWAIVRVPVKAGSKGEARTLQFVKFKNNNASASVQQIQKNCNYTLTADVKYFDFVVPTVESTTEIIFRDSNGLEYRRKVSSAATFASHKIYTLPVIADVDDTGRYIWIFDGEEGPSSSPLSDNAPFTYWFRCQEDYFTTMTRGSGHWTQTAWVQDAENFKYRFGFCPTLHVNNQGRSAAVWGTLAESKTTINGAANQVMRFPVHTGNYPIFAVKITKLSLLGVSRSFKIDVNSVLAENQTGNTFIGRDMPVKYTGNSTSKTTLSEDSTTGIYYFDLSKDAKFKNNTTNVTELLPNTRTLHFTGWQLQIPDVKFNEAQDPLPTCDIYWAGFFNSKSELEAFAASH